MLLEVAERCAGVRLASVGKAATAPRTRPHPTTIPVTPCCASATYLLHSRTCLFLVALLAPASSP
jgi:hypothetical protein